MQVLIRSPKTRLGSFHVVTEYVTDIAQTDIGRTISSRFVLYHRDAASGCHAVNLFFVLDIDRDR